MVRLDCQAEQGAGAAGGVPERSSVRTAIWSARSDLHQVAVAAVDGQDVAAGRDHQAERAVQVRRPG